MTEPGKRMLWLRTLDAAAAPGSPEYLEAEFASEVLTPLIFLIRLDIVTGGIYSLLSVARLR